MPVYRYSLFDLTDDYNKLYAKSLYMQTKTMINRIVLLLALLSAGFTGLSSQQMQDRGETFLLPGWETLPCLAVKTNLLYDAAATFSLGFETRLSERYTLDVSGSWNPWTFSSNRKFKHIAFQPELRYWIYEPFNGHFLGIHPTYVNFNAGNLNLPLDIFPGLNDYRYRGNAYGLGFSYGYQWILSPRWNLEASFGFGYLYTDYNKYECHTCSKQVGEGYKHYFGPTKAALSVIYIIR